MGSVSEGLRAGDLRKDAHDRLVCAHCQTRLELEQSSSAGWRRVCPDCGQAWTTDS
ncbi:MAG: hypothetical protein ABEJ88_05050 [Halobacterium sp.]